MDLNNNDLYKKHDQLIQLKRETYEKLYNRCKNTIKLTSDAGELICLFEIPNFLFGSSYPIINIQSCANYIMNKLTIANNNIKTTFIEPNIIFIDWRRDSDIKYHQVNNNNNKSSSNNNKNKLPSNPTSSTASVSSTNSSSYRKSSYHK